MSQPCLARTQAQRLPSGQQCLQGGFHACLAFLGGQVEKLDIIPVCPRGILGLQPIVGLAVRRRRIEVGTKGIAGESPGLAYQPGDDMPIVDEVPLLPTQPRHPLHEAVGIPDLHLLNAQPHFDHLPDQPRWHGIGIVPHLDRAAPAHPDPPALLRLEPPCGQRSQQGQLRRQPCLP